MSELTRCNFCTLRNMRRRYGDGRITLQKVVYEDERREWTEVLVDGEVRASFLELTDRCVC